MNLQNETLSEWMKRQANNSLGMAMEGRNGKVLHRKPTGQVGESTHVGGANLENQTGPFRYKSKIRISKNGIDVRDGKWARNPMYAKLDS